MTSSGNEEGVIWMCETGVPEVEGTCLRSALKKLSNYLDKETINNHKQQKIEGH